MLITKKEVIIIAVVIAATGNRNQSFYSHSILIGFILSLFAFQRFISCQFAFMRFTLVGAMARKDNDRLIATKNMREYRK